MTANKYHLDFVEPENFESITNEQKGRFVLHHLLEARKHFPGLYEIAGRFTGSGDSADDCSWEFTSFNAETAESKIVEVRVSPTAEACMTDFVWSFVDDDYGGWENNEGGFGTVTFNLDNRSCILDMYYRIESEDPQGETALFNDKQDEQEATLEAQSEPVDTVETIVADIAATPWVTPRSLLPTPTPTPEVKSSAISSPALSSYELGGRDMLKFLLSTKFIGLTVSEIVLELRDNNLLPPGFVVDPE